ncbi:MAG: aspartate carbamoyltransferase regulatory subunit [Prevotellaceae bacterium]|nr:aspartate carbamoyltransferase regulatory subunit [Prevotellaceae bacterium]
MSNTASPRKEMMVAAIENGTVIDHIPADKIFQVMSLLHLERIRSAVTIGYNLESKQMGRKSIIKIADKHFSDDEISQLAVLCRHITLSTIRDYQVVEKRRVTLPDEIVGIARCPNPKCITNHEPMRTRFHVIDGTLTCHYCNNSTPLDNVTLI